MQKIKKRNAFFDFLLIIFLPLCKGETKRGLKCYTILMALNVQPGAKNHEVKPAEMPAAPATIERVPAPERVPVRAPERPRPSVPEAVSTPAALQPAPAPAVPHKSPSLVRIESVLEEDLVDFYKQLTPDKQAEFKKAGEETARKIDILLAQAKVQAQKILKLITQWLRLIPGVNKYFLEQEAKIKTDKILAGRR